MLIIPIKEGENIERALKKYKKKFEKTNVMKQLRARKEFEKPSISRRQQVFVPRISNVCNQNNCNITTHISLRGLGPFFYAPKILRILAL